MFAEARGSYLQVVVGGEAYDEIRKPEYSPDITGVKVTEMKNADFFKFVNVGINELPEKAKKAMKILQIKGSAAFTYKQLSLAAIELTNLKRIDLSCEDREPYESECNDSNIYVKLFNSFPFVEKITVCTFLTGKESVKQRQPLPNFTIKAIAVKEPLFSQTAGMIFPNVRNLEEVIVNENMAQANLFDYFEQNKIKFARLTYNGEINGRIPFNILSSLRHVTLNNSEIASSVMFLSAHELYSAQYNLKKTLLKEDINKLKNIITAGIETMTITTVQQEALHDLAMEYISKPTRINQLITIKLGEIIQKTSYQTSNNF